MPFMSWGVVNKGYLEKLYKKAERFPHLLIYYCYSKWMNTFWPINYAVVQRKLFFAWTETSLGSMCVLVIFFFAPHSSSLFLFLFLFSTLSLTNFLPRSPLKTPTAQPTSVQSRYCQFAACSSPSQPLITLAPACGSVCVCLCRGGSRSNTLITHKLVHGTGCKRQSCFTAVWQGEGETHSQVWHKHKET